mmetsp:Transcript_30344/g.71300  ORF Transcript_30344/g.71300 Transcript_30344/m.71300 type:complete len:212 (+) Transcript_30344:81-716(+)
MSRTQLETSDTSTSSATPPRPERPSAPSPGRGRGGGEGLMQSPERDPLLEVRSDIIQGWSMAARLESELEDISATTLSSSLEDVEEWDGTELNLNDISDALVLSPVVEETASQIAMYTPPTGRSLCRDLASETSGDLSHSRSRRAWEATDGSSPSTTPAIARRIDHRIEIAAKFPPTQPQGLPGEGRPVHHVPNVQRRELSYTSCRKDKSP